MLSLHHIHTNQPLQLEPPAGSEYIIYVSRDSLRATWWCVVVVVYIFDSRWMEAEAEAEAEVEVAEAGEEEEAVVAEE